MEPEHEPGVSRDALRASNAGIMAAHRIPRRSRDASVPGHPHPPYVLIDESVGCESRLRVYPLTTEHRPGGPHWCRERCLQGQGAASRRVRPRRMDRDVLFTTRRDAPTLCWITWEDRPTENEDGVDPTRAPGGRCPRSRLSSSPLTEHRRAVLPSQRTTTWPPRSRPEARAVGFQLGALTRSYAVRSQWH
jgi:hypothetical protein